MPLRAGPLTLRFDAGDLRYIRRGDREVIRRIYAAVRDRNWGTVPSEISDLKLEISKDCFRIGFISTHRQNEIHFVWQGEIAGDADGTIRFTFDGEARSTFLRNRVGFCVLHPIRECAGAPCRARYVNGHENTLTFPDTIAAEQPVIDWHDLAGLAHEIEPGIWAELRFEGDVFEMEDQRNWIDASFKTYGTPLRVPFPVEIKAGTRVRQEVTLKIVDRRLRIEDPAPARISNQQFSIINPQPAPVMIERGTGLHKLPALGLGVSSDKSPENFPNKSRLGALHLAHLRHDVRLVSTDWRHELLCASMEAAALKLPLELVVHLPGALPDPLTELAGWFAEMRARFPQVQHLLRLLVFQDGQKSTPSGALLLARSHFADLGVPIGAGTNADLYQLNLQRPPGDADFICWSVNPQVHAFDNASIAETPEAAAHQVASVRRYFPGKPIVVSPITLKPRFNPNATGPEPAVPPGELPPQVDPRQLSLFGAAWTLAMLKVLAESGADSVTFYETSGWKGVMETPSGSTLPEKFPSIAGAVFPLYHVLADAGEFAGGDVVRTESSEPLSVTSLLLQAGARRRLLLANFLAEPRHVMLQNFDRIVLARIMDASNRIAAMTSPETFRACSTPFHGAEIELGPHAIATLDFAGR